MDQNKINLREKRNVYRYRNRDFCYFVCLRFVGFIKEFKK